MHKMRVSWTFFYIAKFPTRMNYYLVIATFLVYSGCGTDLTRPGYKPPPDTTTRPPIEVFQDAENDLVSSLHYEFAHKNFHVLKGLLGEVNSVVKQYPPGSVAGGNNPKILNLHILNLIDQVFKEYMSRQGFDVRDMECVRDYSRLCPKGWTDLGDGSTCESPPALYEKPECRVLTFGGLLPVEKSNLAFSCAESVFPCYKECLRNYTNVCPMNWSPVKNGSMVCRADLGSNYTKPCVSIYDFTDHNIKMKRKFESICKVFWPCNV